jgi:hypothetical protein
MLSLKLTDIFSHPLSISKIVVLKTRNAVHPQPHKLDGYKNTVQVNNHSFLTFFQQLCIIQ